MGRDPNTTVPSTGSATAKAAVNFVFLSVRLTSVGLLIYVMVT